MIPIVQTGTPTLRTRAREVPVEEIVTPGMQQLVAQMIETMREAPGVGLAAPQIDVPLRVIVLEERQELLKNLTEDEVKARGRMPFDTRVFFNPVLGKRAPHAALYIDRMKTRSFATTEHAQTHFAGKSIADVCSALGI